MNVHGTHCAGTDKRALSRITSGDYTTPTRPARTTTSASFRTHLLQRVLPLQIHHRPGSARVCTRIAVPPQVFQEFPHRSTVSAFRCRIRMLIGLLLFFN